MTTSNQDDTWEDWGTGGQGDRRRRMGRKFQLAPSLYRNTLLYRNICPCKNSERRACREQQGLEGRAASPPATIAGRITLFRDVPAKAGGEPSRGMGGVVHMGSERTEFLTKGEPVRLSLRPADGRLTVGHAPTNTLNVTANGRRHAVPFSGLFCILLVILSCAFFQRE